MDYLRLITQWITRHPRQRVVHGVDFEWSGQSWTHNFFRTWEMALGRRCGRNGAGDTIRIEATTIAIERDGVRTVIRRFYTVESIVAHVETMVRSLFVLPDLGFRIVRVPQLAFASPYGNAMPPIFSFAIAFDVSETATQHGATASITQAHTCTGSNLVLIGGYQAVDRNDTSPALSSYQYNSVNLVSQSSASPSTFFHTGLLLLVAPATGANNAVLTWAETLASSGELSIMLSSYTGCAQSGQPDAKNDAVYTLQTGDRPVSVTTIADNCWVVGVWTDGNNSSGTVSAGAGTTYRSNVATTGYGSIGTWDNNAAKTPAGSVTLNTNNTAASTGWMAVVSLAPVVPPLTLSVTDSSATTDTPTIAEADTISKTDSTAVTATQIIAEADTISVTDSSAVSEVKTMELFSLPSVTDSSAVSDTPSFQVFAFPNVTDSTATTDTPIIEIVSLPSKTDSTAVSETLSIAEAQTMQKTDSSAVTDTVQIALAQTDIETETTAVSETLTIELFSFPSVTDSSPVTDTPTIEIVSFILKTDSTAVSDGDPEMIISYTADTETTAVTDTPIIAEADTIALPYQQLVPQLVIY